MVEIFEDALYEAARGQSLAVMKILHERKRFPLSEELFEEAIGEDKSALEIVEYLQSHNLELPFNILSVRTSILLFTLHLRSFDPTFSFVVSFPHKR